MKSLFVVTILIFSFFSQTVNSQVFIPFASWGCTKQKMFDEDSSIADFNLGTYNNTMASGNSVVLSVGMTSGSYRSRVFDASCGTLFSWYSYSWKTTIPYEKEITAISEDSNSYSGILSNLMSNLLVYYNFNETSANSAPSGNDFQDRSGNAKHATETGVTYNVSGKFINAIRLNGTTSRVSPTNLSSTGKNYTFSFWFKTTMSSSVLSYLFDSLDGTTRFIIAPTCSSALCSVASKIAVCYGPCSSLTSTTINSPTDGNWHHLAVTTNTATGNVVVYLDYTTSYTYSGYGAGVNINSANRIGSRYDGTNWYFNGDLDEVAIWNRTLSQDEILQIYRRGANRVRFQFRSCTSSTCADNPAWRGPDGTTSTYFNELYNNTLQSTRTGNSIENFPFLLFSNFLSFGLPSNKYFQYQATLQTDNVTYSPDFIYTRIAR